MEHHILWIDGRVLRHPEPKRLKTSPLRFRQPSRRCTLGRKDLAPQLKFVGLSQRLFMDSQDCSAIQLSDETFSYLEKITRYLAGPCRRALSYAQVFPGLHERVLASCDWRTPLVPYCSKVQVRRLGVQAG